MVEDSENKQHTPLPFPDPPQYPLSSVQNLTQKEENGSIVNKCKNILSSLFEKTNYPDNNDTDEEDDKIRQLFPDENHDDSYSRRKIDGESQLQYLNVNDSSSSSNTFLTGNDQEITNFLHFPEPKSLPIRMSVNEDINESYLDRIKHLEVSKTKIPYSEPHSKVPGLFETFSLTTLQFKAVSLSTLKKRLENIYTKRKDLCKANKRFLNTLSHWSSSNLAIDTDSMTLIKEIDELFRQDLLFEHKIKEKLNNLTTSLEFVCKRENELIIQKKTLITDMKKYEKMRDKKGDFNQETQFLLEKVITSRRFFDSIKVHFQNAVSVTTRQLFKELAIEYYECCSDLKQHSGAFIENSLVTLERLNSEELMQTLEDLRRRRAHWVWQKLPEEQKKNPRNLENMRNGIYDCNDSLLKNIYKKLPEIYTPVPVASPEEPHLNFLNGYEETNSFISKEKNIGIIEATSPRKESGTTIPKNVENKPSNNAYSPSDKSSSFTKRQLRSKDTKISVLQPRPMTENDINKMRQGDDLPTSEFVQIFKAHKEELNKDPWRT
ncbi:Ssp1p NDAI_0C03500 [Naumovozyma dairenensis CBS 421]|uniref:Uncharacterized protein n=1 Tax=Naumovozyma dairenensis (strain ATCC 10597 / BCRC 20456 / CBS 421 / NBRC 0211 / NRRL Y-12639) TaxID=1071378 RepID=G0W899_NAUDC|nr:hypothetical protein NDAI_0C03500 [Naumovozyma dairenensis CBS 421]CCD24010.1 hypothetical protein NDAI_0C03500 [Naumovozyma dairenensis CBS 421]